MDFNTVQPFLQFGVLFVILGAIAIWWARDGFPFIKEKVNQFLAMYASDKQIFIDTIKTMESISMSTIQAMQIKNEDAIARQRAEFLTVIDKNGAATSDALRQLTTAVNHIGDIVNSGNWTNGSERRTPADKP